MKDFQGLTDDEIKHVGAVLKHYIAGQKAADAALEKLSNELTRRRDESAKRKVDSFNASYRGEESEYTRLYREAEEALRSLSKYHARLHDETKEEQARDLHSRLHTRHDRLASELRNLGEGHFSRVLDR